MYSVVTLRGCGSPFCPSLNEVVGTLTRPNSGEG